MCSCHVIIVLRVSMCSSSTKKIYGNDLCREDILLISSRFIDEIRKVEFNSFIKIVMK